MKKYLVVFIYLFWLVSTTSAGELITGAFGIKLGEPLDLNLLQGEIIDETTDCDWHCIRWGSAQVVRPESTNKLFHSYKVFLTPITKIVTRIDAFRNDENCKSTIQGIIGVLKEKYGEPTLIIGEIIFDWDDRNDRSISLLCGLIGDKNGILIKYELNEGETEEILLKERTKLSDPSGL